MADLGASKKSNQAPNFLRENSSAQVRSAEDDDERAILNLPGRFYDSLATATAVKELIAKRKNMKQVLEFLQIPLAATAEELVRHSNFEVFMLYCQMKMPKIFKNGYPYGVLMKKGEPIYFSEEEFNGNLYFWLAEGYSPEKVGGILGFKNPSEADVIVSLNYRAFQKYRKWHNEYYKFAKIDDEYLDMLQTRLKLEQWAASQLPIAEARKRLKLKHGLPSKDMDFDNSLALEMYEALFEKNSKKSLKKLPRRKWWPLSWLSN
ncbi:hypothetical protein CCR75_005067 [Bremia lactucae]|uniref:Uncharacterized protein n=1 Tax=Bremia lactucae TaxID=4779 RepID=A0A976IMA6_BRELC|nr:hypothetical protein CCR75_005067 [Bremia lactucae]